MSEFLQQFLDESRELIESASDGLAILERLPQDTEQLDAVLRAFHTLKGGAGIVEFGAMERTMHAAEDILSAARTGESPLSPTQFGQCLACIDQAIQWLEIMEQTGELPENAARQADQIISGFGLSVDGARPAGEDLTERSLAIWLGKIGDKLPDVRARAATAVRFVPAADSFYQAEDPLARMMSLPGLLALDCTPISVWGSLESLDPFVCNLILTALSAAPVSDVAAHMKGHTGECDVVPAAPDEIEGAGQPLPPNVTDVIKAQRVLLSASAPQDFAGRVASAGLVAANALRFCGRIQQAHMLSRATERSLLERSAQPLQQALADLFTAASAVADANPDLLQPVNALARTVRVGAERVDALVRLAGELTVAKNAIGHVAKLAIAGDPSVPEILKDRHGALERLIGELQGSVLGLRVRPLRAVLQRLPPLVREMSASLGKPVRLTIEGDDTEADKTIVEMLFEPLLHLVRNALDHGVESPTDRAARGKPTVASLRIRADRESDQVLVEVSDDGSGIDLARVREVAKARSIVTEELLRTMAEPDIVELIFAPGFSTATKVTQVSGRGVGMDAVRKAVERVGGKVSVASSAGHGTTVRLLLPFSVMMTHVMTVEAGGQMFGLPLDAIIEMARVPRVAIAQVGSTQAVVLRNRTIPLVDLATILGVEQQRCDETDATVVVVAANGGWGGVRVDRVVERLDLILKPLDGLLAGTRGIAGTTLLGDGRVLLVLDIGQMLQ